MNMMRFNEGGMTSEMLQQAMEAQAANMGQDITGDSFILTGQYSSPVQQEEDGREYVEYQHPDMQEPVKVYGNWNEYAVSQDENGMMLIGDEDYPIMQDEQGNYMLNEQKFDDQMTAMTERQGAEAMAREAAQGSTQGASQMQNLMEMLQDAQGPQGQGGQYEHGGQVKKYFAGGLFNNPVFDRMNQMREQASSRAQMRRDYRQQQADAQFQQQLEQQYGPIPGAAPAQPMQQPQPQAQPQISLSPTATGAQVNVAAPGATAGSVAPAPPQTEQVPMQDPNAAVANQAAAMAQPQSGVATIGGGRGIMQHGGKIKQQTMKHGGKVIKAYEDGGKNEGRVKELLEMLNSMDAKSLPSNLKKKMRNFEKGGRVIKAYEEGGKNGPDSGLGEGPFSQSIRFLDEKAQSVMKPWGREFEQALADGEDWATDMKESLSSRGYSMSDVKEGNVPAHVVAGLSDNTSASGLFRRVIKNHSGIKNYREHSQLASSLLNYGEEILDGYIDVDKVDSSMANLGYEDQDARFMANAMATRHLQPQQFEKDIWSTGTGSMEEDEETTRGLPTANEFRQKFRKSIGKDGKFKGDDTIYFQSRRYRDTGSSEKPNEDFEGDPQEVVEKTDPIDPIDPIRPVLPEQQITGQIIPPRQEEEVIVRKKEDDEITFRQEEEEDNGGDGGGLPASDIGRIDITMPSDYTGGEDSRATGPFANQTELDRMVNFIPRAFGGGGRVIKYSDGGSFPDLNKDGKITMADILKGRGVKGDYAYGGKMRSYENGGETDEYGQPKTMSHEDLYKRYLKSRNKKMYTDQAGVADIIKEQERLFMQRGRKFADGTGYNDLFEHGGKMKNYAYGGKVLRFR